MIELHQIPPAFLLFIGALIVPILKGKVRAVYCMLLPALGFFWIMNAPEGIHLTWTFLDYQLVLLKVDPLSKAFGYIFTLSSFAAFVYLYYLEEKNIGAGAEDGKDERQWDKSIHLHALMYVGCAMGVVFAGDMFTLYMYWELMAITSTFLILSRRGTGLALAAGYRYVLVHLFGGLVLLCGLLLLINETGLARGETLVFSRELFSTSSLGSWLVLIGFLINAAAPPIAAWLPDAYPEATITGGIILSAYTSKTAVYTLIRGFPEWNILIWLGCIMSIYGIIYALLENDMRRILAYSIVNQVGFMVCGVGIGTELALNGAVAHAFCHIIYKALLWMSAGAVLYMTGKSKCTELGGLYKTMPWTMVLGTIGALAISSVPGTSGFTSKSMIIDAAAGQHVFWAWLVLEIASAGVFLHAGIKFPYFVFFNKDRGLRPGETNKSMLVAMGFLAFLCIFLGVYPDPLYAILPFQEALGGYPDSLFTFERIVNQTELLIFSGLVFFLFLSMLKRTDTISLDTDWFYRKGSALFYGLADKSLNGFNKTADTLVVGRFTHGAIRFFKRGPRRLFVILQAPFWRSLPAGERQARLAGRYKRTMLGSFPIGMAAFWAVFLLLLLYVIGGQGLINF